MTKGKKEDLEKEEVIFDCFVFFCIFIYISLRSVMIAFVLILQPYRRSFPSFLGARNHYELQRKFSLSVGHWD